jgi:hypothetical protein
VPEQKPQRADARSPELEIGLIETRANLADSEILQLLQRLVFFRPPTP